jgi:adenylate cyclase, class 2
MMPEIEIKVLGIDLDKVVTRLEALGAKQLFAGTVSCLHFDNEDRSIRKSKSLWRLRRWAGDEGFPSKFEICYKGKKEIIDGCKVREEIETTVEDADKYEAMLNALGYQPKMDNDKRRLSYELNDFHVDIDSYPQVPVYLEIEGANREVIDRALDLLELRECEESTESADELFKRLWPEIDFDHLKF